MSNRKICGLGLAFVFIALSVVAGDARNSAAPGSSKQLTAVARVKNAEGLSTYSGIQVELLQSKSDLFKLFEGSLTDTFDQETTLEEDGGTLTAISSSRTLGELAEIGVENAGDGETYYLVARGKHYIDSEAGSCLTIAIPLRPVKVAGLSTQADDTDLEPDPTLAGHKCTGAPCSSCSFRYGSFPRRITGCKCNDFRSGTRCNHTLTQ